MATKTLYLLNPATATPIAGSNFIPMQDGGSAPSTVTTGTGWTVGTTTAGKQSQLQSQVERAASTFGDAPATGPDALSNTLGNALIAGPFTGMFEIGAWVFNLSVRAVSSGGDHDGHFRLRMFVMSDPTDTHEAPRPVRYYYAATAPCSNLATSAAQACVLTTKANRSTVSAAPLLFPFALDNEYLLIQLWWVVDGAGGAADRDVLLVQGAASSIVTPNFRAVTNRDLQYRVLFDVADRGYFIDGEPQIGGNDDHDTLLLGGSSQLGRMDGRLSEAVSAGSLQVDLTNRDSLYPIDHEDNYLGVWAVAERGPRLRMETTVPLVAPIQTGYLDNTVQGKAIHQAPVLPLSALGALADFGRRPVKMVPQGGIRTGAVFGAVLNGSNWPAADRVLDTGVVTMGGFAPVGADAQTASRQVAECEVGEVAEDAFGRIVFEERTHRLTNARSTTVQATFTAEKDESNPISFDSLYAGDLTSLREQVFDYYEGQFSAFEVDGPPDPPKLLIGLLVNQHYSGSHFGFLAANGGIWDTTLTYGGPGGVQFVLASEDPFQRNEPGQDPRIGTYKEVSSRYVAEWVVSTTPGEDIIASTEPANLGRSEVTGQPFTDFTITIVETTDHTITLRFTNTHPTQNGWITNLNIYGYEGRKGSPVKITAAMTGDPRVPVSPAPAGVGTRRWPHPGTGYDKEENQISAAKYTLERFGLGRPIFTMTCPARNNVDLFRTLLGLRRGDRIHITGLTTHGIPLEVDHDCYVEGIGWSFDNKGRNPRAKLICSQVQPLPDTSGVLHGGQDSDNYAIFDAALFDTHVFA